MAATYLGLPYLYPHSSDFRYTGHYYHEKSDLHLAPYRAYDSVTGRWISEDPIQEVGGINLYGYAGNGPLDAIDPLGLYINVYGPTAADRAEILAAIQSWTKGKLSLKDGSKDLKWNLQREPYPDDGEIERTLDALIKSDKPYIITRTGEMAFSQGGTFQPANGGGGTIMIEPSDFWGTYESAVGPQAPNLGMILAHELLGRAKVDLDGGKHSNEFAFKKANAACERMGIPLRIRY
ncbi:RHS repeat-associated core domain-containing protein [Prosthecobacter debontii]|uniref:RHS repeat-associated core domain-containing protein n=1 Tax=Prosthecobacter debontii TaxID=48467 RepID=UPI001C37E25F|nr:RHS repeat-associated core domain-containing protein [Prosthecobacter debontii]